MDAAGYGIKVSGEDRYWYLRTEWSEVVIELGDVEVTVGLTPSFWGRARASICRDGRWFSRPPAHRGTAANRPASWLTRQGNRFAARLLKEHNVLLRASQDGAFPSIAGSAVGEGASGDGLRAQG
jgi:hypothetical protein